MNKNINNRNIRKIQIDNIFIEIYRAFPAAMVYRDDIELTNSIILPQSALGKLSVMKNFGNSKDPILFRILNIELNIFTHCGVADFTAEEGVCYIPTNMFERLCLTEGQTVNIRNVELKPGTFIKLQPHLTEFINNPNPKTILEYNLRNYFCVSEGDTISVQFNKKIYKIDIVKCEPNRAIRTLNCDIVVDFDPPKDYKEPPKNNLKPINNNSGSIVFNSNEDPFQQLNNEEIKKKIIEDKKFSGHHFRMDGKDVTNTQVKKIMQARIERKNEENYNPRECRIISHPRPSFKYVEL